MKKIILLHLFLVASTFCMQESASKRLKPNTCIMEQPASQQLKLQDLCIKFVAKELNNSAVLDNFLTDDKAVENLGIAGMDKNIQQGIARHLLENNPVIKKTLMENVDIVHTKLKEHGRGNISTIGLSPDGTRLALGTRNKKIIIRNRYTGTLEHIFEGHTETVRSLAWSLDGNKLASGSNDQTIGIWNMQTGTSEGFLAGHRGLVRSVTWNRDGTRLASGSWDNTIGIWNIQTSTCELSLKGHASWVMSVDWSPDGKKLASGSTDKTIRIWNVQTGECERVLLGHTRWVDSVNWRPDGKKLASGSADETIGIWNVQTGDVEGFLKGHKGVRSVNWSRDGKKLASGAGAATIGIWDMQAGGVGRFVEGDTSLVHSVEWSPDDNTLVFALDNGTIHECDLSQYNALEKEVSQPLLKQVLVLKAITDDEFEQQCAQIQQNSNHHMYQIIKNMKEPLQKTVLKILNKKK